MDVYITFYHIENNSTPPTINIRNGFSFGREKKLGDVDLFFSLQTTTAKKILDEINKYKPKNIWCSVSFVDEFIRIKDIISENWIIGGPLAFLIKDNIKEKAIIVQSTMEEYLRNPLDDTFDFYFEPLLKKIPASYAIVFNCSLGFGCYWRKCTYCDYSKYGSNDGKYIERPNTENILKSVISKINSPIIGPFTCISSTPPTMLKKIINNKSKKACIGAYIRGEQSILDVINEYDDLTGISLVLGIEGFSQKILDELHKGYKLKTALEIGERILEKNGRIRYTLMGNYTFLTKEIVKESIENIREFKEKLDKKKNKCFAFHLHKAVLWDTIEQASTNGFEAKQADTLYKKYFSNLPEDSDQYIWNNEIYNELRKKFTDSFFERGGYRL